MTPPYVITPAESAAIVAAVTAITNDCEQMAVVLLADGVRPAEVAALIESVVAALKPTIIARAILCGRDLKREVSVPVTAPCTSTCPFVDH